MKTNIGTLISKFDNSDYPTDHLMVTYSAEGFKDLLDKIRNTLTGRDEHGTKPSDAKPGSKINDLEQWTPEGMAAIEELKKALKKYYLNDNWLKGQTFVEGTVDASDFSKIFEVDGKIEDPFKNIDLSVKRIVEYGAKWNAILKPVHDKVIALDEKLAKDTEDASLDDEEAIDKVRAVILEFSKLAKVGEKAPKFPNTILGNTTLVTKKDKDGITYLTSMVLKEPKGIDVLPALDKEGVIRAAKIILSCYDYSNYIVPNLFDFTWLDHSDGSEFNEWIYDADNSVYMEYYDYFYHQRPEQMWTEPVQYMMDTHKLASALERWIDRSIK